ncbi:MAG TPA: membrane dipeptidase [Terriglobales bacterium]|nr:membrane dipeptidase [Terriglobales bacterium]
MLTRRDFAKTITYALAFAGMRPALALPFDSSPAEELYARSFVLDCNGLASIGQAPRADQPDLIKTIRESGIAVVKTTLGGATFNFEQTLADIAAADQFIENWPDAVMQVRTAADMTRAYSQHKLGLIYSFESPSMLEGKLDRIDLFRHFGVRVMQLTYNRRSPFGVGCLDGETEGLTDLGRQAIAKMNDLGVALDLSHSNTATTREGIAVSKKPPIFSHAGCRAIYMHPRNKEDQDMKALADKGGVMGIYMLPYLTASPKQPQLDDYLRHMEHALKICGEDHVGIGSDIPLQRVTKEEIDAMQKEMAERKAAGIAAPGEDRPPYIPDLNTPRKMEIIAGALLKRGYSSAAVEKVLGSNFRRVFTEIWNA